MTADSKQSGRGDESALSRWSRRKLEARQQQAEPRQAPAAEVPAAQAVEPAVEAEQPPLTDADMPAIDSLGENSDYSQFRPRPHPVGQRNVLICSSLRR